MKKSVISSNVLLAGAIAGFFGGAAATASTMVGTIIGVLNYPLGIVNAPFMITHVSFEVLIHLIYGPIFGVIYVKLYDWIPSKGVLKGLIYSLLIYLISNVRPAILIGAHSTPFWTATSFPTALLWVGFFVFLAYGLVLGYLYKPTK